MYHYSISQLVFNILKPVINLYSVERFVVEFAIIELFWILYIPSIHYAMHFNT